MTTIQQEMTENTLTNLYNNATYLGNVLFDEYYMLDDKLWIVIPSIDGETVQYTDSNKETEQFKQHFQHIQHLRALV